jgi:hypothetical protein
VTGGDSVSLILPDGVRESYDRKMKSCEAGWRETKDPWAVAEATTLTFLHRQVTPLWLDEAVWHLAVNRRTKAHAKRANEAHIRFMRYEAVKYAHADGLTWEKAVARAVEVLAETLAAAEPDSIWKSYKRVKADLKAGRGGLYFTPKKQHRPGRKGPIVPY